jgi:hypothetical protein
MVVLLLTAATIPGREAVAEAVMPDESALDAGRVLRILRRGVAPATLTTLVEKNGVTFALEPDIESQLRKLGATQALLHAIAQNQRPVQIPSVTIPTPVEAAEILSPVPRPTTLKVAIAPGEAASSARVRANDRSYAVNQMIEVADGQDVDLSVEADGYKIASQHLELAPGSHGVLVTLCAKRVSETYWFQPSDVPYTTYDALGVAKQKFATMCPQQKQERESLADQACAQHYPDSQRDPRKKFDVLQAFDRHSLSGITTADVDVAECTIRAECARVGTDVRTPSKVLKVRLVDNDSCESRVAMTTAP